jgi:UDP-N-acetylmuramate dehydrogenase
VKETIVSVKALERRSCREVELTNEQCAFGYRQSRFKGGDADVYVITEVTFRLPRNSIPQVRYPELQQYLASRAGDGHLSSVETSLQALREAVLAVRRRKSMVVDPRDPHSRSVGSFFMNPVLSEDQLATLRSRWLNLGGKGVIPTFPAPHGIKVPAAWLVEHAGFPRGFRAGGVGISQNHALALVNYGGTTQELLELAARIQEGVFKQFGIRLEREPVVVPA